MKRIATYTLGKVGELLETLMTKGNMSFELLRDVSKFSEYFS